MGNNDRRPKLWRVIEELPAGFDALQAEVRSEGYLFIERLAVDWVSGTMRFDRAGDRRSHDRTCCARRSVYAALLRPPGVSAKRHRLQAGDRVARTGTEHQPVG